ncbi:hypothetical protein [Tenacibaculum halocynthiae]|uniref:hypothetical protein n=1 Tax=Tenacibaculum halocynthiae TaxID=1254437 RepID=UPI003D66219A
MTQEKRYIIENAVKIKKGESFSVIASVDPSKVKDKNSFFDLSIDANKVYDKDWEFDYLFPRHSDEYEEVGFLCDLHGWIGDKPNYFYGFPISKKMKEIIGEFNLYPNKFYNAKVLFKEEFHEYYIWQLFLNGFDKFVDLEHSTFCEWDEMKKIGSEVFKFNNEEELTDAVMEKEWWDWGFERAVMKPEFKEIDCMAMPYPYGILISERLKNALEEAELTGFEIIPFPVDFEYLE